MAGIAAAGNGQSAATPAKQWLTAMDPDNDGTVDKKEFNAYMDAHSIRQTLITTEPSMPKSWRNCARTYHWRANKSHIHFEH